MFFCIVSILKHNFDPKFNGNSLNQCELQTYNHEPLKHTDLTFVSFFEFVYFFLFHNIYN